ncbi:carboxymuconolactone decarboxylase family protein [Brevundimonas sp.]|uniref:carboxymuconolactone decarboxylase family protein n=1 Tax=Brevundimonas sp. TaxID=1871086 RepID=UPI0028AD1EC6|nr:carboxymuconolactone decarboxylase family protein [Brevundimonas sp.]
MTPRIANPAKAAPDAYQAMVRLEQAVAASGLEHSLLELLKIRVSQINGCAYCLHMHTADARRAGEDEVRLHLLAAWRESSLFSPRERAALTWAESLTRIEQSQAPAADYAVFEAEFSESEQVNLAFAIGAINVWNRLAVGFRSAHPAGLARVAA